MVKNKKVEFPTISLNLALLYLEKIVSKNKGQVATYEDIGKSVGKSGGNLARIVAALKAFNLIERSGVAEWKVTELGKRLSTHKNPEDLFTAFVSPPLYGTLWTNYKENKPTLSAALNFLEREGLDTKRAKKLSKLFRKSYDLVSKPVAKENICPEEIKRPAVADNLDKELYQMASLMGALFPIENKEDIQKNLNQLESFAQSKNFRELAGFISAIRLTIGTEQQEMQVELRKVAPKVREIFEKELQQGSDNT